MKAEDYIDRDENFPSIKIKLILNTLKPGLMLALDKALNLLPQEYVVDSIDKLKSTEMRRQYLAFDRAVEKWHKKKYAGRTGRPAKSMKIIQKVYFTMVNVEAPYKILSAFIFDEYRKIREKNERVD